MLVGKLQLNPETGEILLSSKLEVTDGLGYRTFIDAVDRLCQTADQKYPELQRAAQGLGNRGGLGDEAPSSPMAASTGQFSIAS